MADPLLETLSVLRGHGRESATMLRAARMEAIKSWVRRVKRFLTGERSILRRPHSRLRRLALYAKTHDRVAAALEPRLRRVYGRLFGLGGSASGSIPQGVRRGDVAPMLGTMSAWRDIFAGFDVVIGYGLDGVLPMVAGKRPYFAFEHGTIRAFPFEDTPRGRLCAATYREADGVFVTNCDNRIAAERLGLERYRFLPHPVNEHLPDDGGVSRLRRELREELGADFIVFHPSRQHWEPDVRSPNWEKGNDVLIRGFAKAVEASPDSRLGLVMVRWGATLEATDRLVETLGIADRVKWIEPLPHLRMCEMILACDVVADQFHLGAFGSLTPKGLMLRRPVLLKLDEALHEWAFDEMPPVVNTSTPEEIEAALRRLATDRDHYDDVASASQRWYEREHSNDRIARILIEEIDRRLDPKSDERSGAAR